MFQYCEALISSQKWSSYLESGKAVHQQCEEWTFWCNSPPHIALGAPSPQSSFRKCSIVWIIRLDVSLWLQLVQQKAAVGWFILKNLIGAKNH